MLEVKCRLLAHVRELGVDARNVSDQLGPLHLQTPVGCVNEEPSDERLSCDRVSFKFEKGSPELPAEHIRLQLHHKGSDVSEISSLLELLEFFLDSGGCLPPQFQSSPVVLFLDKPSSDERLDRNQGMTLSLELDSRHRTSPKALNDNCEVLLAIRKDFVAGPSFLGVYDEDVLEQVGHTRVIDQYAVIQVAVGDVVHRLLLIIQVERVRPRD